MEVVEIRVRPYQAPLYYEYDNLLLDLGRWCVIEHEEGEDLGVVVRMPSSPDEWVETEIAGKILRVASPEDREKRLDNKNLEMESYRVCKDKIKLHGLPMKLVVVESLFDRSKLKFYFTSEQRVDFRELVRDLAHVFKTRIELRQIGVRDEAKILDGYGICGQRLCCSSYLRNFNPISIKMAKNQDLALNPSRLSGLCGRLKCCLVYEDDFYTATKCNFPRIGTRIFHEDREWTVESMNILSGTIYLKHEDIIREFFLSEVPNAKAAVEKTRKQNGGGCGCKNKVEDIPDIIEV